MRMRRPRPSTFVCRSFVEVLFGGGFFDGSAAAEVIWRLELLDRLAAAAAVSARLEQASSSFFSSNWNGKLGR